MANFTKSKPQAGSAFFLLPGSKFKKEFILKSVRNAGTGIGNRDM